MTGEDNDKNNEGDICEQRHDCHNAATKPPRSRVWTNRVSAELGGRRMTYHIPLAGHPTQHLSLHLCLQFSVSSGC
jgi:hypothetical protein